jgi:hypothetical protein
MHRIWLPLHSIDGTGQATRRPLNKARHFGGIKSYAARRS